MAATILLPAGFGALHAERLLLAEADGAEAVGRDAQRDEILLDGTGAAITEAEVIFGRTTLIAMTFDGYLELWIALQEVGGPREGRASIGTNVSLVIVEIGVADFSQEKFIVRGASWVRRVGGRIINCYD